MYSKSIYQKSHLSSTEKEAFFSILNGFLSCNEKLSKNGKNYCKRELR